MSDKNNIGKGIEKKVRHHIINRYRDLVKLHKVVSVDQSPEHVTEIHFEKNTILRVNKAEYQVLKSKIQIADDE